MLCVDRCFLQALFATPSISRRRYDHLQQVELSVSVLKGKEYN